MSVVPEGEVRERVPWEAMGMYEGRGGREVGWRFEREVGVEVEAEAVLVES